MIFSVGLLASYYTLFPLWTPYPPYILDGRLFWILIPATIINIFPCVNIGKVHTGRLWFHHYVYGFLVAGIALVVSALSSGISSLFIIYTTDIAINTGRFLIVGGATLVIDDLADVSMKLRSGLCSLKNKARKNGKILHAVQLVMSFITLYFFAAVVLYLPQHPAELTLANYIFLGTLLITVITSFANVKRKVWLNISCKEDKSNSH